LYPAAISGAFSYTGSYESADTLTFGVGYWIKFGSADSGIIRGDNVTGDSIPLRTGWNLVGAASAPVPVGAIATAPNGILSSSFFSYEGGYDLADTLNRGRGYWIKSSSAGTMYLSSSGNRPLTVPLPRDPVGLQMSGAGLRAGLVSDALQRSHRMEFSDASSHHQKLYFAESADLSAESALFGAPPSPPATDFSIRFASGRILESVAPSDESALAIRAAGIVYPLTVSWNMKDASGYAWKLAYGTISQPLEGDGKLVLAKPPAGGLTLTGSPSHADLPAAYDLRQNYPNPFNPTTRIDFAIKDEALVMLKVYDVLGREVGILVNEKVHPGRYHISWDASDQPSGVYYVRLQAHATAARSPDYLQVRKMLLVR
jgi:hypothetical protein